MSKRRLPETELANFASLDDQIELTRQLREFDDSEARGSYKPVRSNLSDLMSAATPLVGSISEIPWDALCQKVRSECYLGEKQEKYNIEVALLLFEKLRTREWQTISFDMHPLHIGFGEYIKVRSNLLLVENSKIFIPFFDFRQERGIITEKALSVLFSMQNISIRERNLDLVGAYCSVVNFPKIKGKRQINMRSDGEISLLPYDELQLRIDNVYQTWASIRNPSRKRSKKTGTDGQSSFLFE